MSLLTRISRAHLKRMLCAKYSNSRTLRREHIQFIEIAFAAVRRRSVPIHPRQKKYIIIIFFGRVSGAERKRLGPRKATFAIHASDKYK